MRRFDPCDPYAMPFPSAVRRVQATAISSIRRSERDTEWINPCRFHGSNKGRMDRGWVGMYEGDDNGSGNDEADGADDAAADDDGQ
jgi:hypothetical protein